MVCYVIERFPVGCQKLLDKAWFGFGLTTVSDLLSSIIGNGNWLYDTQALSYKTRSQSAS